MDVEASDDKTADLLLPPSSPPTDATLITTMPALLKPDIPLPPTLDTERSTTIAPLSIDGTNAESLESHYMKHNGDSRENEDSEEDKIDSSDCDALVIDEKPNRKRKSEHQTTGGFKGFKRVRNENDECEFEPPMNPYFNESIFDLSGMHCNNGEEQSKSRDHVENSSTTLSENADIVKNPLANIAITSTSTNPKRLLNKKKKEAVPRLREYAQYLGLQPAVQFKCSKCFQAGFPSLSVLNEHHTQCTGEGASTLVAPSSDMMTQIGTPSSTNFRVTRKVYLCSACGTYYENWNLFMHMLEMHKRFICLYCLGMFSKSEKLSAHLSSKHNCVPNQLNTEEDFFRVYKEPCYVMCCDCESVFNENDNFFGHDCNVVNSANELKINNSGRNEAKNKISLTNSKNLAAGTIKKQSSRNIPEFIGHVTGDTWPLQESQDKSMDLEETRQDHPVDAIQERDDSNELSSCGDKSHLENQTRHIASLEEEDSVDQPKQYSKTYDISGETTTDDHRATNLESNQLSDNDDYNLKESKIDDHDEPSLHSPPESFLSDDQNMDDDQNSEKSFNDTALPSQSPPENCDDNSTRSPPATVEDILNDIDDFLKENNKSAEQPEDTRKVPKVTLKLPKLAQPYIENGDVESDVDDEEENLSTEKEPTNDADEFVEDGDVPAEDQEEDLAVTSKESDEYPVAGPDVPIIELELEQPLDKFDIRVLLQKCLKETIPACIYCNHARKISVNGKQLGLHAIAQHRFSAVVNSITAEELIPESFNQRIRESLDDLEKVFISIESNLGEEITFSHIFECFQCRYATTVHKDLYLHNRKMHAKTILLCVMCKSNFYSYSELICHLCPGVYETQDVINDISFRCCMCITDDLPSAFRLMVHLRKRHNACDVCLDLCQNQSRLSNHVWKHKLHHFCYRCGVAYRNKPDITKHLFWKHGTESVLCKKCLQKKWPHVYHFCIPPSTFTCEECNMIFSKAVALKVHKRLHRELMPHSCTFENCTEKFISKKLLLKHEFRHRELPEEERRKEVLNSSDETTNTGGLASAELDVIEPTTEAKHQEDLTMNVDVSTDDTASTKVKVDATLDVVYNLPELNLSESSDSEDEIAPPPSIKMSQDNPEDVMQQEEKSENIEKSLMEVSSEPAFSLVDGTQNEALKNQEERSVPSSDDLVVPPVVLDNIWDDFKNYQANKVKSLEGQIGDSPLTSIDIAVNALIDEETATNVIEGAVKLELPESVPENKEETKEELESKEAELQQVLKIVQTEHDYCVPVEETIVKPNPVERTQSIDHDYCSSKDDQIKPADDNVPKEEPQSLAELPPAGTEAVAKPNTSSDSSNDSDSSNSCSNCSTNCSCTSSSDSSNSSSDESSNSDSSSSEGRRKQQARREKRRQARLSKQSSSKKETEKECENEKLNDAKKEIPVDLPTYPSIQEQQIEESDLYTTESETDEDFYDKQPQKLANKLLAEKRKLLLAGLGNNSNTGSLFNGSLIESSRPSTPSLPETEQVKLKKKSKNKKKKKKNKKQSYKRDSPVHSPQTVTVPHPVVSPITLSLPKNSPCPTPLSAAPSPYRAEQQNYPSNSYEPFTMAETTSNVLQQDTSLRASKRRRIPNKFYGYSSDEERREKQQVLQYQPPVLKWRKADLPSPARRPTPPTPPSLVVPPLTIKKQQPFVTSASDEFRRSDSMLTGASGYSSVNYQKSSAYQSDQNNDSASESNDSSSEEEEEEELSTRVPQQPNTPSFSAHGVMQQSNSSVAFPPINSASVTTTQQLLYCYCRCPYDEVSEMIGCDSSDCAIEWFHFECVGIMVPPKGQWFCPDCRKKKQAAKERHSAATATTSSLL